MFEQYTYRVNFSITISVGVRHMISGMPQKIRELRMKYNFTQKQVGEKVGVSPSIISGYETGERTPSVEVLLALSYLFNCSTDYLLGKNNSTNLPAVSSEGLTQEQISALNIFLQTIKKEQKVN